MAEEDIQPSGPVRRITARRGRMSGGGGGAMTRSESLRTSAEDDEVDSAVDPERMQQVIFSQAGVEHDDVPDSGIPDPRQRMNEVAMAGSAAYSREYRLTLLARLLMRRIPLDQIAKQLKVSVSTVEKDRALLKQRLREKSREMNVDEMIGTQNEVYDEVQGMALQMATLKDTPAAMKLAAMRTALAANADRTRFLASAGVFDVMRYRRAEDGSDISDVQMLMNKTNDLMERMLTEDAPKKAKGAGGFAAFDINDADASNSTDENVEL